MATVELGRRHFATRRRSNNLANIDYIWNQDSLSLPVNDQPPSRALPQQRVFGARNNGGPALNNNATSPENNTENASKRPRGRRFQGNTAARPQQDNDQQARSQPPPGTGQTNNNNDQARSHLISPGPRNPTNNSSNSNANTNPGRVPRRDNSNPRRSNRTTNQASNNGGNIASGNLANNPPISKRAAKRRRARARKAEAALQEQQNAPINVVVQTRPTTTTVAPGATPALIRTPNNPPVNGPRQNTHPRTAEATTEAISRPPASTWIPPRPPVFVRTHVPPPATSRLSRTSLQEPPSQNLQPTLASLSSRLTSQTSRPISSRSSITPPPNFPDLAPRRGDLLGSVLRATRPAPVRVSWVDNVSDEGWFPHLSTPQAPNVATIRASSLRRMLATCSICLDISDNFPSRAPTTRCTHEATICAPCLEQHIAHAIFSSGSTTISCPDAECRQTMEYADVKIGARKNRCFERYEALVLRRALQNEPDFVWCKNPTCDAGQVHDSGAAAPIVTCRVCRAQSCFTHDVPWHIGLTCTQYTAQRSNTHAAEDRASEECINRIAKTCPGPNCGRRIQKNDGCDHMTCRRPAGCGHEFCWICLADYRPILTDGNHRHNASCSHYFPLPANARLNPTNTHPYGYPTPNRVPPPNPFARVEPITRPNPNPPPNPDTNAGWGCVVM